MGRPPPSTALIFGRRGYLASAFAGYWDGRYHVYCSQVDVTNAAEVASDIAHTHPALVLNAAGITHGQRHPNIDGCEESAMMKTRTARVNIDGAVIVAEACRRAGVPLAHLGSGCIYDGYGARALDEGMTPNPPSWYSHTKAVGDAAVAAVPGTLVVRLRMPFGRLSHPRNLLTKLAHYRHVIDAPNSLTYVPSLLSAVTVLMQTGAMGVYHVVQPEPVSPYRLMRALGHRVEPWTPEELNAAVVAPRSNCVLSTARLQARRIWLSPVSKILGLSPEAIAWQAG